MKVPHFALTGGTAAFLVILIGCVDAWAFKAFGLDWDKGLITAGVAGLVGTGVTTGAYEAGVKTPPEKP